MEGSKPGLSDSITHALLIALYLQQIRADIKLIRTWGYFPSLMQELLEHPAAWLYDITSDHLLSACCTAQHGG